jgi:hypothetical protein
MMTRATTMANPRSAVLTEARRRAIPMPITARRQPIVTAKKQPGDGLGTIRRFGNGYDRARTSLENRASAGAHDRTPDREGGQARRREPRRELNQAEADQQCHDPGDGYCTGLPRERHELPAPGPRRTGRISRPRSRPVFRTGEAYHLTSPGGLRYGCLVKGPCQVEVLVVACGDAYPWLLLRELVPVWTTMRTPRLLLRYMWSVITWL